MRIICLALLVCMTLFGQGAGRRGQAVDMARKYELKPMAKPDWATRTDAPLFRVAWFSDTHVSGKKQIEILRNAFDFARMKKANLAIFTGDNSPYAAPKWAKAQPKELARHAWFRAFLDTDLGMPYKVICGDNWYQGFIEAFGSRNFAFDAGGYHFIFTSLDVRSSRGEGCAEFTEDTLNWIRSDLAANSTKPTLFVLHEPLWPPTFLGTSKVEGILKDSKNVVCGLAGHLHLDLDFNHGSFRQLVCPAIGLEHRPGFKLMSFYEDAIIIESCELNQASGTFFMADKWQRILIPRRLKPAVVPLDFKNTSEMPPIQVGKNDALFERSKEVYNALMGFAITVGVKELFK